jgi:hypothetical protein
MTALSAFFTGVAIGAFLWEQRRTVDVAAGDAGGRVSWPWCPTTGFRQQFTGSATARGFAREGEAAFLQPDQST